MIRKKFIQQSLLATGAAFLAPVRVKAQSENKIISLEEIQDFVFAAHSDLDKTRSIVDANPLILNCTNQFKKGDFETAIGGASHMGRKDIADMLVERGARLDIFNLTFLGHTDLVKQLIEVAPAYLKSPGPHGFTLLHHANVGKHEDFASWLQDQGLEETHFKGIFE